MSREIPKPFLILKDEEGRYRLTVREVRYNSQNYPLVTSTKLDETFKSAAAARAHAKEAYGAEAGQFASK
ncbi:MAG: hypothetical protein AB7O91_04865 [Sphingomonas sp.]